jgi:hypothetical protein
MHNSISIKEYQAMQISRHWRLNSQRYRLQGVHYENGVYSLQARPTPPNTPEVRPQRFFAKHEKADLKAAS